MEEADILIHGCLILPMDGKNPIKDGAITIKNGKITFIGQASSADNITAEVEINAEGKAAMPGLINCHTHAPMTLFRGIAEDQPLEKWLKDTIWPLEAKLKPKDIYTGALLACTEMIKTGTTCFADMYFHEDMVAKAVEKSGLRASLAEGIIEAGKKTLGKETLHRSVDFAKKFNRYADGRITAMLGPHAAYSCSPTLLKRITEEASKLNVGLHLHLAESKATLKGSGEPALSEVEFLDKIALFRGHILAAHCINLSRRDMHILHERGVHVVHVPVANMKLGLGAAKIKDLTDLGVNVSLGTDGPASNNSLDMFETMKVAALLQKLTYSNPTIMPAYEILKMATINGAEALGLAEEIGTLTVGKRADIILIDLSKPNMKPLHNIYASLIYSAHGSDVDTVIVDGKILMENRQVKTLDEETVMEEAERAAFDLLKR
ncbi:MAG: amidohydrolase [Candidatus Bathyarchaeia archaeon]